MNGRSARSDLGRHTAAKPRAEGMGVTCPACDAPMLIVTGSQGQHTLVSHDKEAEEAALDRWEFQRAKLHDTCTEQSALLQAAQKPVVGFEEAVRLAQDAYNANQGSVAAATEQARIADATPSADNSKDIQDAERRIEHLRVQRDLVEQYTKAKKHHESVAAYTLIAALLGPKGIRAKAMESAMTNLGTFLSIVAQATGWPLVEVDKTYNISIGKRAALKMCSESERWRGQVSLQIAIGRLMRDPVIVLDRVDVLDEAARLEFTTLLQFLADRDDPPALLAFATSTQPHPAWTIAAVLGEVELPVDLYWLDGDGVLKAEQ